MHLICIVLCQSQAMPLPILSVCMTILQIIHSIRVDSGQEKEYIQASIRLHTGQEKM